MAVPLRIEFSSALYPITSRSNAQGETSSNDALSLQEITELEAEAIYSYANSFNKMAVGFVTWFLIWALIVLVGFAAYSMVSNA